MQVMILIMSWILQSLTILMVGVVDHSASWSSSQCNADVDMSRFSLFFLNLNFDDKA
jgi:hypothetical protein